MLMVDDVTALIKRVTLTSSVLDLDYSECLMTLYTERFVGSDEVKGFRKHIQKVVVKYIEGAVQSKEQ